MLKSWIFFLIALALLALCPAQSQQRPPGSKSPGTDKAQQPAPEARGSEQLPFIVKVLPSAEPQRDPHKEEQESAQKLAVDNRLASETERIADYTKGIVGATLLLFVATLLLWIVTGRSWNLLRREFNTTHRPRIRIKHITLLSPVANGEPLMARFSIVNSGGTAAVIINFVAAAFSIRKDSQRPPLPPFYESKRSSAHQVLVDAGRTIVFKDHIVMPPISDGDAREILGDFVDLYCAGAIEYVPRSEFVWWRRLGRRQITPRYFMTTAFCRKLVVTIDDAPSKEGHAGRFVPMEKPDEDYEYQD